MIQNTILEFEKVWLKSQGFLNYDDVLYEKVVNPFEYIYLEKLPNGYYNSYVIRYYTDRSVKSVTNLCYEELFQTATRKYIYNYLKHMEQLII